MKRTLFFNNKPKIIKTNRLTLEYITKKDQNEMIEILTNEEKGDYFPHWKANGKRYKAKKIKGKSGEYDIYLDD